MAKKFSQRHAKKMYRLLAEIHSGLKDKNRNNYIIPFIEMAWINGIENCLRKKPRKSKNQSGKLA
jgi:hypothetical protein